MRPRNRLWLVLLLLAFSLSASAESARSFYNKGRKAEARQDYIAAYEAYAAAYEQKPEDLRFRVAYQRMRFLAAAAHVNHAQDLRKDGKLDEALAEFEVALKIDPSSFIAQQEIKRTQDQIAAAQGGKPAQPSNETDDFFKDRLEHAPGPVDLAPVSNAPITLKIANDSKMVYETIGKLAGINVLFDPDYTSRRVNLELNNVSLNEALDILAFQSHTFWRAVTPNTIFIAADTPQKRKELEQNVLKTFYLSNATQPTDLQDIVNTLRQILEIQRVQQVVSQSAIVVRATPDQMALAEKIISDIDKARPEVIVEVAIMQVRRDKLRDLGIQPPGSISASISPATTTSTSNTSNNGTGNTTTGTGTTTTSTGSGITINTLANITDKDISLSIPAATANFLLTDSNTTLIQNPQVRASDGQKASIKIGDRVPVATGSFGTGVAAGAFNPLGAINTQFQYLDVGVNIDITPRVHANREVTLKLMLDVSSVTGSSNIGGISQPIISQRKVEHEIRLKEGEVNLLGGIFENTDTKSIAGIPGLARLPFLKYLFSDQKVNHSENEIVFVLTPHIVRGQELTEQNLRPVDIGTANQIDLRRVTRPAEMTTGGAAPAKPAPMPQQPAPQQPVQQAGALPQAAQNEVPPGGQTLGRGSDQPAPGSAGAGTLASSTASNIVLSMNPAAAQQTPGSTFNLSITATGARDLYAAPMQISYNPKMLELVNVSNGDLLSKDGQPVALAHREDTASGVIQVNGTRPPGTPGISGDGVLYVLTFRALVPGSSTVEVTRPSLRNASMGVLPMTPPNAATITVR